MALDSIPVELLVRIFGELNIKDTLRCSQTCRFFHDTIKQAIALQYRMELTVAGVEDTNAAPNLPVAQRLTQLQTIEDGWDYLRFRKTHRVKKHPSNLWELFGGVLVHGLGSPRTRGLAFMELPSAVREMPGRTWSIPDTGVDIRDFGIDPGQNLVVLISAIPFAVNAPTAEYMVHLRTMNYGASHSQATAAILSCEVPACLARRNFVIQIMDEYLGVLFHTGEGPSYDQLRIWNWKSGRLVTWLGITDGGNLKIDSFSFLSPRHFVVSKFRRNAQASPTLEVYDFLTSGEDLDPRLIRLFQFPSMINGISMASMITRSDPSPGNYPASQGRPFIPAPTSRILTVSMDITYQQEGVDCFIIFMHISSLLENEYEDVTVPWEKWGPEKTRFLQLDMNERTWVCYVHGTRYVRLELMDGDESEDGFMDTGYHIRMIDFNSLAAKRDEHFHPQDECSYWAHRSVFAPNNPTTIKRGLSPFVDDVVTHLPYRESYSREPCPYSAVMIDGDCLVGLLRRSALLSTHLDGFEFLCV
ncbi:hypothetical protein K439DRAFT_1638566 [Ramaria rubella]|nr:hypothetical protein K439DRAFT_1638566 [Ramaria rubella]